MRKVPLKYLFEDQDRHGNQRRYFRRRLPGQDRAIKIRLYSEPESDAFAREYLAALQLHGLGFFAMTREDKRPGTIYFAGFDEWVKIGFTTDLEQRITQLQTACPARLVVYAAFPGLAGYERSLQRRFLDDRAMGEWFRLSRMIKTFIKDLGGSHDKEPPGIPGNISSLLGGSQTEILR